MTRFIVWLGLLLILLPAAAVQADNNTFGVAWGISIPTGNTSDYISKVSFRGASFEWRNFYMRDAAYGLNVGWNVFNEEDDATVAFDNGAITGKHWKYINAVPIYASWFKYFGGDSRDGRFFAGLNAGTAWIQQTADISLIRFEEDNWHFAFAPEVGYHLPWDKFLGYVAARYHVALSAGSQDTQQWLEFKIGFGLD